MGKRRQKDGRTVGARPFSRGNLYQMLSNPIYVGDIAHKGESYPGRHEAILDRAMWHIVQRQLRRNASRRRSSTNSASLSLLTGLAYDDTGDRLVSTHVGSTDSPVMDRNIIDLVARTRRWWNGIRFGEIATVRDIASREGIDEGDVSRLLPLAFLAPDIVEAILSGTQPVDLTAEKLKRIGTLPISWTEQRRAFRFEP